MPLSCDLLVKRVVAGSPAEEMGLNGGSVPATMDDEKILMGGEIILEVNNLSQESEQSLFEIRENLTSFKESDPVVVKILRAGQILELKSTKSISQ